MIEAATFALFVVVGLGVVAVRSRSGVGARLRTLDDAARLAGLRTASRKRSIFEPAQVAARHGAFEVRLEPYGSAAGPLSGTTVMIGGLSRGLSMQRDAAGSFAGLLRAPSVPTGHEAFDTAMRVSGPPRLVRALLDAATRERVLDVFCGRLAVDGRVSHLRDHRASLANGWLTFDCPGQHDDPVLVARYVGELLALAEAITPSESVDAKLLANLRADPEPNVRLECLRELLADGGRGPIAREALRSAVADGDERVQIEAAIALGADGQEALREIAVRGWSSDVCAARAVTELGTSFPVESVVSVFRRATTDGLWQTARACLHTLGRAPDAPLDVLVDALRNWKGGLAAAAARALGRAGDARTIPLLREAEARFRQDPAIVEAVRAAIASIRSRLGDAHEGQVSLTDAEAGRVSVTSEDAGQVALAPDAATRPPRGRA